MAEFPAGQERLLKQIISNQRCSICRRGFDGGQVRVAAHPEQLWIVGVRCALCRNQQVFYVALRENDAEADFFRDMTEEEEVRFDAMPAVSFDDVLDMHLFLTTFDGNFKQLFCV